MKKRPISPLWVVIRALRRHTSWSQVEPATGHAGPLAHCPVAVSVRHGAGDASTPESSSSEGDRCVSGFRRRRPTARTHLETRGGESVAELIDVQMMTAIQRVEVGDHGNHIEVRNEKSR